MSAKAFGFGAGSGVYKYIAQNYTNGIYGTNSPNLQTSANWTLLSVQPPVISSFSTAIGYGVVHHQKSITTTYYQSTKGGTYSAWASYSGGLIPNPVSGKNGMIATNPTSKLTGAIATIDGGKGSGIITYVFFINSDTGAIVTPTSTFSGYARNICYSPALNCFYVSTASSSITRIFDGTTGAFLGTAATPIGTNIVAPLSVTSDGYILLIAAGSRGYVYAYKMTAYDFTTSTLLNSFIWSAPASSTWLWNTTTSLYYFLTDGGSGYANLYSTDATATPSLVSTFYTLRDTIYKLNIMFNENNVMYLNAFNYDSGGGSYGNVTYYSTDNGTTVNLSGISFISIDYNPT